MIDNIMRCNFSTNASYWDPVSEAGKDFVHKLLVLDPRSRMTATQALKHKWLEEKFKLSDRRPDESIASSLKDSLVSFKNASELKQIALNVSVSVALPYILVFTFAPFPFHDSDLSMCLFICT
jgi:calcium-dependent protein kinase